MSTPYDNPHFESDRQMTALFSDILNSLPPEHHAAVMSAIRSHHPKLCITHSPQTKKVIVETI